MVKVGSIPTSPRSNKQQRKELIKVKLQDNQEMVVKAEMKITQKDIDFLFNGWNDVKEPTLQQVIDKAIEHLNNTRAVKVAEQKHAGPAMVLTDGEGDIRASMALVGY